MARVPLICVPNSPSLHHNGLCHPRSLPCILIIINDAALGDAFHVYATLQSIGPTILSLWVVGLGPLSKVTTAVAVALAAFVVVLSWPQSTNLIAKRISLGQIVPPC
ncbi:hypothetical protein AAZX31_08G105200 [Glycine max]